MSFSTTTKNEITLLKNTKSESIAVLSAFVRNNAYIKDDNIIITTENIKVASMIKSYIKFLYNINVNINKINNLNLYKNKLNEIRIKDKVTFILEDLGYQDNEGIYLDKVPEYIVGANEEIRAYLRGVFLSSGSINDPKSSYHMELTISKMEEAIFIQKLLNIFELNAKILSRDKGYMIYIKEAEKISDYLKLLHANNAVMYYENIRIYHEEKNKTNRLNNCEQANTDKIVGAGAKQLDQIELIEENIPFDLLDDKIKEAITYRKKYPETSLKELSEIISLETGKPITKSGLNHRFRKIKELSDRFNK
jgi:DNA-binding protein WhiA